MLPKYKFVYFNFQGRGELHRYIFAQAGQEYEDFRFDRKDWRNYKDDTPFGQVPVLEVTEDGKTVQIAQSVAIARFLARRFGLYGKNDLEMAEIDMYKYADQITDLANGMIDIFIEKDEAKKKELQEKLLAGALPDNLKLLDSKLANSSSGFLIGDSITWVDFHLIVYFDFFHKMLENILPQFPRVVAHNKMIKELPRIADWIAKRPADS